MLRIVFALLLAANLGYYLWSHGQLAGLGLEPAADAEPQRLERQIRPEALQIVAGQADAAQPQAAAEPAKPVRANRDLSKIASEPVVKSTTTKEAAADDEPEKPKKGGWWQRRGFF